MRRCIVQGYRLSPQQKHLWSSYQASDKAIFSVQCAIRITGPVDVAVLTAALREVVNRHQILRTTFHCFDSAHLPVQVIEESEPQVIGQYDLGHLAYQQQIRRLKQMLREERDQPFNCESGPIVRWSLVRLSADAHRLIITLTALCADSKGLNNLVREVSRSYATLIDGEAGEREISEDPLHYIIASEWQNELFETEDFELGRGFCQKQALLALDAFKLPFGRAANQTEGFQPECITIVIGKETKIDEAAGKYGGSASIFLLTCWQILMGRLTGQTQVIAGICCDGRIDSTTNQALGLFAKFLPIRTRWDGCMRFCQLLKQVKESEQEACDWQEWFSWEHLLGMAEDKVRKVFLPICFDYEGETVSYSSSDVTFSVEERYTCIDRFELKLSCANNGERIILHLHYNTKTFKAAEAERIASQYSNLVESAIENIEAPIDELEIPTPAERRQLLVDFNCTRSESPQNITVKELFEKQVERAPEAIAVIYETESLTYAELNRSANQLAHGLRRFVTGAEIPVALCVERSLEMVLGLLAVLKAGGAYVPLDPSYPAERMRQILEDSRAAVVLTQQRLRSRLPESCAQLIEIDSARSCAAESSAPPPVGVDPRNLAYIIYTSGSTGRPKGVGIEHAQLVSYVMAVSERLKLEAGWSMGLVSTFAANLGYTTLYPSLCGGGVLHVLSEECGRDPRLWEQYQSQRQIECLKITPTQIRGLVEGGSGLPRKRLVLGGESCSREWVSRARDWSPGCEVVNHYGPTECTVGAVTHRIEDEVEGEVPIGKPLSNAWTYVLGSRGEVVPTGAPGELYIGGDGVGRGYLNQAQLTAERFVPDEYSGGRGRRLYRTGDLVRYRMDGNLEFIGRIDQQVKIRGFRIELGEIEAVLRQQPEVREAVVMVEESESAGKRLVAYVVGRSKSVPKNEELKSYLKTRLPDYMVPSVWVMLEEMPLMPNGKVDRRVLRVPEESEMERIVKYEPPQTPTEQMVAEIWSDLLALDTIGNQDNFFSLGGHSMLAAQMIARVRKALQIELSLVSLFEAPTVADFAAKIDAMRRAMAISSTTSAADISIRSPVTFRSRAEIE
jgi:amino acid adenylation domain-containing protein